MIRRLINQYWDKRRGVIVVRGSIEGNIVSRGRVVIDSTGRCTSKIRCHSLDIHGNVVGSLDVGDLVIYPSGYFSGSAKYSHLTVHEGACFQVEDRRRGGATPLQHQISPGTDDASPKESSPREQGTPRTDPVLPTNREHQAGNGSETSQPKNIRFFSSF